MFNHFLFKAAVFIIVVNVLHSLIAILLFRDRQAGLLACAGLDLEEINKRRKVLSSYIICFIFCLLPYRIRECFVLLLYFILYTLKAKILKVARPFSVVLKHILFFIIYFMGIPLTIFFKKIMGKEKLFIAFNEEESDIMSRY